MSPHKGMHAVHIQQSRWCQVQAQGILVLLEKKTNFVVTTSLLATAMFFKHNTVLFNTIALPGHSIKVSTFHYYVITCILSHRLIFVQIEYITTITKSIVNKVPVMLLL